MCVCVCHRELFLAKTLTLSGPAVLLGTKDWSQYGKMLKKKKKKKSSEALVRATLRVKVTLMLGYDSRWSELPQRVRKIHKCCHVMVLRGPPR